jgi:predicted nucleic acid-binding protein
LPDLKSYAKDKTETLMYAVLSRMAAPDGIRCRSYILGLPISVDRTAVAPDRLLSIALAHGLTAYDAAYLELALRHKVPIAARDGKLQTAAENSGVGLVQP